MSFVTPKSKASPHNTVSITRSELMGAALGLNLGLMLMW